MGGCLLCCAAWCWGWWLRRPAGLLFAWCFCGSLGETLWTILRSSSSTSSSLALCTRNVCIHWAVCAWSSSAVSDVGHQDLVLNLCHSLLSMPPGFHLDLTAAVWRVPNEVLGPLLADLGLPQGSEGSHDSRESCHRERQCWGRASVFLNSNYYLNILSLTNAGKTSPSLFKGSIYNFPNSIKD